MTRPVHEILIRPLLTERSTKLREQNNQYVFHVAMDASKPEIRQQVERQFKVKVVNIRTVHVPGKTRRMGRFQGQRSPWKKAILTLAEGQKIDLVEEAA